jgi:hypothetical protein
MIDSTAVLDAVTHIVLQLRHVLFCRAFLRKRPGQHELGLNPPTSSHGLAGVELTKLPLNALTSNQSNCNASVRYNLSIIGKGRDWNRFDGFAEFCNAVPPNKAKLALFGPVSAGFTLFPAPVSELRLGFP